MRSSVYTTASPLRSPSLAARTLQKKERKKKRKKKRKNFSKGQAGTEKTVDTGKNERDGHGRVLTYIRFA